jgi:hypothetical protein
LTGSANGGHCAATLAEGLIGRFPARALVPEMANRPMALRYPASHFAQHD